MSDSSSQNAADPKISVPSQRPCWSVQGIWGNGKCDELKRHTHCRNCPTYSTGAAQLLNRPLPPHYREDWTGHFSEKKAAMVVGTESVLVFRLQNELLAVATRCLQEVGEPRLVRTIPHRKLGVVLGLVNVRGELAVCVSLARALTLANDGPTKHGPERMLIIKRGGERFAFVVDEIRGIERFHVGDLSAVPGTVAHGPQKCIRGLISLAGRRVGILDEERLFQLLNQSLA